MLEHRILTGADKIIICCSQKEMWRYNILLDCIRIESTHGNFSTHDKVAIPIPIVMYILPIPIPNRPANID